jgi:CHAT domain-containing protein/Tfp pilus assembly protein PilF
LADPSHYGLSLGVRIRMNHITEENGMTVRIKIAVSVILVVMALCLTLVGSTEAKGLKEYYEEGIQAARAGRYQEAINAWKQGLNLAEQQGNEKAQGVFLRKIGLTYKNLNQYQKALSYLHKALAITRKIGDVIGEGYNLSGIGFVYSNLRQYDKALSCYQKALAIYRKIGDLKGEGFNLSGIGLVYNKLNQYQKALSYLHKALAIDRKTGYVKGEGSSLASIGDVYRSLGQYQKALSYLHKALAITRKIGDVRGEGSSLASIGGVYRSLGQYQKALSYYQKALAIDKKIGDLKGEGSSLASIGGIYKDLNQYQKALSYYQKALAIDKKIGDLKGEGFRMVRIGLFYNDLGEYDKALSYYQKALPIFRKMGYIMGEAGSLGMIGDAMLRAGKPVKAEIHYESAIEVWESIRGNVKTGKERTIFQSTLPDLYTNLAVARLAQGDHQGAFEAIERGRAKSFLDLLGTRAAAKKRSKNQTEHITKTENKLAGLREKHVKLASAPVGAKTRSARKAVNQQISEYDKKRLELIDQLRRIDPELGSLTVVNPPTMNEIQSLLAPGAVLLEYFHSGNKLWIFVVHARGLHFKAVSISKSDLKKTLEKYAKLVADESSDPKSVETVGVKLYKWLIEPIEPISQLTDSQTLVIVPWGPMFKIPFAALAPKGGKPLGAKKNIVMAPSAGVYRYLVKKRTSGRKNILAIGNPKTAMAPLPGAEKEAREIAGLFGKSAIYTKSNATEALIKKDYAKLGRPDVIHLACHGIFNEKAPQLSHLALTPDQNNDGKLEMHELFDLDWRGVSLVTMSACSSGKGKLGAGDDLVGLTRGFMFAGAPSILCSLWDVDDEATRALMVSFYKNYLGGMSKPEALRKAQMAMMNSAKWSHPYYWSAFVLFGDWE